MAQGHYLAIDAGQLGEILTNAYIVKAGDGTNRLLGGVDLDTWQRIYRYLVQRSKLGPPPIKLPLYSPEPAEQQEWDIAWYKGTGLSRLFSLDPCQTPSAVPVGL